MNHLAHLFLADRTVDSVAGNLGADHLRGRVSQHHERLRDGIRLHRTVDAFTDSHAEVIACKRRVQDVAGRYSGVVIDLFFDHLLASEWSEYSEEPLEEFAQMTYALLTRGRELLPEPLRARLPRMIDDDWLVVYQSIDAVRFALDRMHPRLTGISATNVVIAALIEQKDPLRAHFRTFFPELQQHVSRFKQNTLESSR